MAGPKTSKGKTRTRARAKSTTQRQQGAEPVATRSRRNSLSGIDFNQPTIRINKRMLKDTKLLPPDVLDSVQEKSAGFEKENYGSTFTRDKRGPLLVLSLKQKATEADVREILADVSRIKTEDSDLLKANETFPKTVLVNSANHPKSKEEAQELIKNILETHNNGLPTDQQVEASSARPRIIDRSNKSFLFVIRPKAEVPEGNIPDNTLEGQLPPPASTEPVSKILKRSQSLSNLVSKPVVATNNNVQPVIVSAQVNNAAARILSVAAFKEATPTRKITLRRTSAYRAIVSKLTDFHKSVAKLKTEIDQGQARLDEPSQRKNDLLKEKFTKERERKKIKDEIYSMSNQMVVVGSELFELGLDSKSDRVEMIKKQMGENRITIENNIEEVKRLTAELVPINNKVKLVNLELKGLMDQNKQLLDSREEKLLSQEKELQLTLDQYLLQKNESQDTDKLDVIRKLRANLGDEKKSKQRVDDILQNNGRVESAHLISKPMEALSSDTASDVLRVETNGEIEDSGTNKGFAKREVLKGEPENDTTVNLGMKADYLNGDVRNKVVLSVSPNLLARQVVSSRLDQGLGLNVLAVEVFSQDEAGNSIGITAEVQGIQMAQTLDDGNSLYPRIDLSNAETQRGLSDLQVLDALTGQMDRHLGNIFINQDTGVVKGIDNDMAFPTNLRWGPIREIPNSLKGQFTENKDGVLIYNQTHIHKDTAERILNMTEATFIEILKGRDTDLERLTEDEDAIELAVLRLRAVKAQVEKLEKEGKLVEKFTIDTFYDSIVPNVKTKNGTEPNYLAKAYNKHKIAGDFNNGHIQGK